MTDTTFDALLARNADRVLRAIGGGGTFVAPRSVIVPVKITNGATAVLQTLPVGYVPLGWMDPAGLEYGREIETSVVEGWGASEPLREDTTKDQETVKFTLLETGIESIGLDLGMDWTDFEASAVTGELIIKKPAVAENPFYRLFQIARDTKYDIFFARCYPRAQITNREAQQLAGGDGKVAYTHTWSSFYDSVAETAVQYYYGGKGWLDKLEDFGLELPS